MELDEPSGDNGVELIDATDPQDVIPNKCVSTPLLPAAEDFVEVSGAFAEAFPEDRSTACFGRLDAKSRLPCDMMGGRFRVLVVGLLLWWFVDDLVSPAPPQCSTTMTTALSSNDGPAEKK